jgi:hypothetical protein
VWSPLYGEWLCICQPRSKNRRSLAALSTKMVQSSRAPRAERSAVTSTDLYQSDTEHFSAFLHSSTNAHNRNALPTELCLWAPACCVPAAMNKALNSKMILEAICVLHLSPKALCNSATSFTCCRAGSSRIRSATANTLARIARQAEVHFVSTPATGTVSQRIFGKIGLRPALDVPGVWGQVTVWGGKDLEEKRSPHRTTEAQARKVAAVSFS